MFSPCWNFESLSYHQKYQFSHHALGHFFAFVRGFDFFNESPLQWWNLWISSFLALTSITGPHVFWGDHWMWSHLVLHKYGQPQCGSVKLSSPLPPPVGLLSISIQKFRLLSPLSTSASMAVATRFQATGTVVSPRSSCHFCCPESLKVLSVRQQNKGWIHPSNCSVLYAPVSNRILIEIACINRFCFSLWQCCPTNNTKICVAYKTQRRLFTFGFMGWLWLCWARVALPGLRLQVAFRHRFLWKRQKLEYWMEINDAL